MAIEIRISAYWSGAMKRRDFLKASAAFAGVAAGGFSCAEFASATPMKSPIVDKLSVRVLVDLTHNIFLRPTTFNGMSLLPPPRAKDYTKELHTQWGLSLLLESVKAGEPRTLMLDFAYTPEALLNNFEIVGADANKINALIVSHGHFDHYGGLIAFLDKYRGSLPADVKLYAGGEDNFCHRVIPTASSGSSAILAISIGGRLRRATSASSCAKPPRSSKGTHLPPARSSAGPMKRFFQTRWNSSASPTGWAATPPITRRLNY